ncbi:hypothetical protein BJ165DRAFT_1492861, partial [Panaeolus papilionaceus]
STGQFGEAAKVHSEAIARSRGDCSLHYKCGSIYFSLQRYTSTLKNIKQVLSLISSDFNNVHLI